MTDGIVSTGATDTSNPLGFVALAIGQKRNSMDIVYLVKECRTNEELTYSLRSLVNLPHNKVFIVGGCPTNINKEKAVYKPILQRNGNKFANTTQNIQQICQNNELSNDFILMNDDFYILKPIKDPQTELNLTRGFIDQVIEEYKLRYHNATNSYLEGMKQTNIFLKDLGYERPLSYELHIPMVLNKEKLLDLFKLPYINTISVFHWRSVYGNLYLKDSRIINDVKVLNDYYYERGTDKFLSTEDNSFQRVKPFLDQLFPVRSPYEL